MSGLGKYLENFLKPIGNELPKLTKPPSAPKKEVLSVLSVPTIGISEEKSATKPVKKNNMILKIYSKAVGEPVYFVDDLEAAKSKIPPGAVVYTRDELKVLVKTDPSREELRLIHAAKRELNGTISDDS
ncbi:MAG: hypothetical protein IEMM0002_1383 [bacterium]|nr:MAG: hypothetical protein IEMM0002_1383 [bacterium]